MVVALFEALRAAFPDRVPALIPGVEGQGLALQLYATGDNRAFSLQEPEISDPAAVVGRIQRVLAAGVP